MKDWYFLVLIGIWGNLEGALNEREVQDGGEEGEGDVGRIWVLPQS